MTPRPPRSRVCPLLIDAGVLIAAALVTLGLASWAAGEVVLLDFGGPWCGPCRQMGPVIAELEQQGFTILRFDPQASQAERDSAARWRVTAYPTFIAIEGDRQHARELGRIVGLTTLSALRSLLHAPPPAEPAATTTTDSPPAALQQAEGGGQRAEGREQRAESRESGPLPFALRPSPSPPFARVSSVDTELPLPPGANQITNWGTATLVYDDGRVGVVLTCWHNFRNARPPYRMLFGGRTPVDARLVATDEQLDLAALAIASPGIEPVELSDDAPPADVIGCGFGDRADNFQFRKFPGRLTATPYTQPGFRGFSGQVRQGDSGGPVLTPDGRLVGVLWGNSTEHREVLFTCDRPLREFIRRAIALATGRQLRPLVPVTPPANAQGQSPQPALPPNWQPPPTLPAVSSVEPLILPPVGSSGPATGVAVEEPPSVPVPTPSILPPAVSAVEPVSPLPGPIGPAGPPGPAGPAGPAAELALQQVLVALGLSTGLAGIAAYAGGRIARRGVERVIQRIEQRVAAPGGAAPPTFP